ncbi:MAG TPA: Imm1 family immunity protein [Pseudonocardiaceae bacterium]|nr:Imm1 family immunity protein [Pseudonocardiaceae bacterium]
MIPLELWYSHSQTEGDIARTHEELDAVLDRIAALSDAEWPVLATLSEVGSRFGPPLYVGFHESKGALMYPGESDREYTLGEGTQDGDPLLYMYMTSDDEFPPNAEVSASLVRQAAHEFADTGLRPACVRWQVWEPEFADSGSERPEQS